MQIHYLGYVDERWSQSCLFDALLYLLLIVSIIFYNQVLIMAGKKKGSRMLVGLICTETGCQNYVTTYNKMNTQKLELMKYCPKLRKHTLHKIRPKLK